MRKANAPLVEPNHILSPKILTDVIDLTGIFCWSTPAFFAAKSTLKNPSLLPTTASFPLTSNAVKLFPETHKDSWPVAASKRCNPFEVSTQK